MKKFFLLFFLLACSMELLSPFLGAEWVHMVFKPLLVPTLLLFYIYALSGMSKSVPVLVALGLSWAGDVLLLLDEQGKDLFIPGLIAFLLAHMAYVLAYLTHRNVGESAEALRGIHKIRMAFPIVLFCTGLAVVLYPGLGSMAVPVLIYAFVLMLMVLNALFRYGYTQGDSFKRVMVGALLFLVSDSLLALDLYHSPVYMDQTWIMGTYMGAQFLIVTGLIRHRKGR